MPTVSSGTYRIGQCMKCRRRMRQVCLNWSGGPACFGCCACATRDAHNQESLAFGENDFRKTCRTCNGNAVLCSTAKCVRDCGHVGTAPTSAAEAWKSHYADAQRKEGKAKTLTYSPVVAAPAPVSTAPAAAIVVPPPFPTPTIIIKTGGAATKAGVKWDVPAVSYEFPFALHEAVLRTEKPHILLYGPPGTGKTSLASTLIKRITDKDAVHITPTEDTSESALTSSWGIKAMSFEMMLGALARGWNSGTGVVVNEVNRTNGTIHTALYNGLDDRSIAQMTLVDGTVIVPKEGFCFIATMNGDPSELPEPLLDRFALVEEVSMPSKEMFSLLGPVYGPLCKADYETKNMAHIQKRSYRRFKTIVDLSNAGIVNDSNRKDVLARIFPKSEVQAIDDAVRLAARARS